MPQVLGLSTYRWNNNLKSLLLLALFPFLLLGLLGGILYAQGMIQQMQQAQYGQAYGYQPVSSDAAVNFMLNGLQQYWPMVLGAAAIWLLIGYFLNDSMIHAATGAKPLECSDAPKLYNILETLCIARGLTVPKLYIIDTPEMNAYASGIDQRSFAVTVTRGILEQLNDREMEAVLAHELTHIINRDCRLLIITIVFVGMISFAAQMLWRGMRFATYGRSTERNNGGAILLLMLIASVIMFVGYMLALVLRFAISRKREYLADAGSVEITKNPEALIGALRKISCACNVPHVPSEVRQMFIENPPSFFDLGGLFATHPPIGDRIRILEQLGGLPPSGKSVIPPSA